MSKKKIIWQPVFTREGFPYFIACVGFDGYVRDMEKRIGIGYRDQLMVSKKNVLTVYSSKRDSIKFGKKLSSANGDFFLKGNRLILSEIEASKRIIKKINRVINKKTISNGELINELKEFYSMYRSMYSVYRFPTIVDQHNCDYVSAAMLKKLAVTKDACGRFFTHVDKTTLHTFKKLVSRKIHVREELSLFMSLREIIASIKKGKPVILNRELRSRYSFYVYSAVGRRITLVTGKEARKKVTRLRFADNGAGTNGMVTGSPAFFGTVTGSVCVARSIADLKKKKGDILVTPMTTIKFIPYLKKFKAIVTDEGGITCHAAIVARELRKPCVIGTKIATKVFRDGDRVQVDATKGIVRKLVNKK